MSTLSPVSSVSSGTSQGNGSASISDASDRFLKLLVTQMKNQDPLNPMDNAQVTSQMAQISTVSGIEKLNATMEGMNSQFMQMRTLQGASMVGREVLLGGNRLSADAATGRPQGLFELAAPADNVKVEILSAGGMVIDTLELGAQGSGRHEFDWQPKAGIDPASAKFRVSAKTGAATITSSTLMRDRVDAVASNADSLTLELSRFGNVSLDQIKSIN